MGLPVTVSEATNLTLKQGEHVGTWDLNTARTAYPLIKHKIIQVKSNHFVVSLSPDFDNQL